MKKQSFNDLLRRYNKYRNKLVRLQESGRNEHRQGVLRKHIERLFVKLQSLQLNFRRKAVLTASCAAVMTVGVQKANAQSVFEDKHINQFSLQSVPSGTSSVEASLTSADLDNDGDLDILAGNANGDLFYYENTGTATAPDYAAFQTNPFSLGTGLEQYVRPSFVDLDGDGDFDILAGEYDYGSFSINFKYIENIGTASSPNFAAAIANPFSLAAPTSHLPNPSFADIDNDGDLDMMSLNNYYENVGTNLVPDFAAPIADYGSMGNLEDAKLVDIDNDGDFDVLGTLNSHFKYFENTGTTSVPVLAAGVATPFSLKGLFGLIRGFTMNDINGDGTLDILAPNYYSGELNLYTNDGTVSVPNFTDGHMGMFSLTTGEQHGEAQSFGDLDGDGDMDMITEKDGDLKYYQNSGTALLADFDIPLTNPFSLSNNQLDNPVMADIDADGDLDLLGRSPWNGEVGFVENTGTSVSPVFATVQDSPFGIVNTVATEMPTFVDLDNDGDLDYVSFEGSAGLFYYSENTGTAASPAFGTAALNTFGLNAIGGSYPIASISFGDLDGDGDLDMLCGERTTTSGFKYFENTGTVSAPAFSAFQSNPFSLRKVLETSPNAISNFAALVDLNGDGDLDLMSSVQYQQVFLYFENIGTSTSSIEENVALEGISMYPNPASTQLTIDTEDKIESITIFDMFGSLVQQESTASFSIEELASGIYIANVQTNEGIVRVRFVKK